MHIIYPYISIDSVNKQNILQYQQISRNQPTIAVGLAMSKMQQSTMNPTQPPESAEINWNEYNYPPILNLMHFRPSELQDDRRTLIIMLFSVHIIIFVNCILNIIANCIEGGIGILYAFLFLFIFNPIVLFLFYRAYMGLCKEKAQLGLFIYLWPLVVIIMIVISIVDFLGFNGFIRVSYMFKEGRGAAGAFGLVVSIIYLILAVWSSYLYYKIFRERSILTRALL